ncbi:hypothetical protein CK203_069519 [Vitis vinifera]|uniref:Uncharacterized protein n=1 Tax=Vitis vinifera TaxID=29760 RepID=A0A438EKX6_VITVI|nr:hypothetical protein CK203_069519 [Vitis vinifera]
MLCSRDKKRKAEQELGEKHLDGPEQRVDRTTSLHHAMGHQVE